MLRLQRRGMNFYNQCPEKEASDFDNFRYYGEIDDQHGGAYYIELTIHWRDNVKAVRAFLSYSHGYFDGLCYGRGSDTTAPTKEAVLHAINNKFGTNYKEIEFY